jgi:hypothetical protein
MIQLNKNTTTEIVIFKSNFDYNSGLGFTIGGNNVLKQKQ